MKALLAQTVPVDIVVIDDGSVVSVAPTVHHPRVSWLWQENTGKRGAQVNVLRRFSRDDYQFILTVDSDSAPYPDACEHLLRAMSDSRVQAATGMIYIRNYRSNWVSFAADIDIGTSCVMMRASRSMLGALETTSGALLCTVASCCMTTSTRTRWSAGRATTGGLRYEVFGVVRLWPLPKRAWRLTCLTTFKEHTGNGFGGRGRGGGCCRTSFGTSH